MQRSDWPLWSQILGGVFGAAVLVAAELMWWLVKNSSDRSFDPESLEPSLAVCQSYIEKVYGLHGSLNAPQNMASARSGISKPSGETTWQAAIYVNNKFEQGKQFECTLRPAGTGYTVTAFRWK